MGDSCHQNVLGMESLTKKDGFQIFLQMRKFLQIWKYASIIWAPITPNVTY